MFQLSEVHCVNPRSRRVNDINLVTFGVFLNKREQGRGTAVTPMFEGNSLHGAELTEGARMNGHPYSELHMWPDWAIGPIAVQDGDTVEVIYTATNTSDSDLPTADQQKVDKIVIKFLDIY